MSSVADPTAMKLARSGSIRSPARTPRPMLRPRWIPTFPLLLLALAGCKEKAPPPPPPPPAVNVAKPLQRDVPVHFSVIGETRGNTEIEIRARVEGFIESIEFGQGSMVNKGDLLYTLDPRPFEAALAQAQAALAEAEAQLARAAQDVARYAPLVEKNAVSRQIYETSVAVEKAAAAAVEAGKAVVEKTRIDLSFTKVLAPEAGLIGKTEVFTGTLVGRGQSTLLTRISRIDPIHARVNVTERDYLTFARERGEGAEPHARKSSFELILADGTVHAQPGQLVFLDRNVDPTTGTILVEVAFPNPAGLVRPGQFARVRTVVRTDPGALLLPQRCVRELQGVFSVLVVGGDGKVAERIVQVGQSLGTLRQITQGLQPDENVIVDGAQKVRPGMPVQAKQVSIDPAKPTADPSGDGAPAGQKPGTRDGR